MPWTYQATSDKHIIAISNFVDSPNTIEWKPIEMKFISLAQHNTCVRHQNPTKLMLEN
jgi:hypothetical protein